MGRYQEGAALPGVVIFTDCRALVQAFGGSDRESVGGVVLLADFLKKAEGVRTVVQWLSSNVGVMDNEIADRLATRCKSFAQERDTRSSCRTERDMVSLPLVGVVCEGNKKKRFAYFVRVPGIDDRPIGWA
ncbi:hypothetical protein PoB_003428400 [Plakobranchus ocellatus]|uniref:RNase H type-1 domain-containing protein n=1 Tax=Plakobranchus ocellatus TaxID=259542 RepID=A0AAV4AN41_9GAST|nr:hypothetical protein PoB_003428400 [Plakobranchus ocellatus]